MNLKHLFLGTQVTNMADMALKKRGTTSKVSMPYGVTRKKYGYEARAYVNGERRSIGHFKRLEDAKLAAATARNRAEYAGLK